MWQFCRWAVPRTRPPPFDAIAPLPMTSRAVNIGNGRNGAQRLRSRARRDRTSHGSANNCFVCPTHPRGSHCEKPCGVCRLVGTQRLGHASIGHIGHPNSASTPVTCCDSAAAHAVQMKQNSPHSSAIMGLPLFCFSPALCCAVLCGLKLWRFGLRRALPTHEGCPEASPHLAAANRDLPRLLAFGVRVPLQSGGVSPMFAEHVAHAVEPVASRI